MSSSKLLVTVDPSAADLKGKSLLEGVIDPEIISFEKWFSRPKVGNGTLSKFEKEILRSFLWWSIVEKGKDDG